MTRCSQIDELARLFFIFLKLGCTSFGGPVAHLGYFRQEFVVTRRWFDEQAYSDMVALCQFLPGPASSQVGMAIGMQRAGIAGAMVSFAGFTLPSALLLVLFALGLHDVAAHWGSGWLHGLKIVAVAVVAQALWGMGKSMAPDARRASIAVAAAVMVTVMPSPSAQIVVIMLAAGAGILLLDTSIRSPSSEERAVVPSDRMHGRFVGLLYLLLFLVLLALLPVVAEKSGSYLLHLMSGFYRSGALVFGGGHVVLPLLQALVVPPGWVSNDNFLAGYGAVQAVPGPLFTFAAYLGAMSTQNPNSWLGALMATLAIFLPGFLLVAAAMPWWHSLRHALRMRRAMLGVNAAVLGILVSAFYQPVWTSAIHTPTDFCLGLLALLLLVWWKCPPWLVVLLSALAGGWLAT
ncbi:chromate transporter [Herbaspirillum sp. Sphag1AN]|uniref:chromate efflux transporter n=1 Tax=unclassified Herbaspirillum TaxID=2624150 RepID=UPI001609BBBF|nr:MULTISPECIES: chromate efflux transporter [unclassified Herbaspirillum]MBB3212706.1 chromate transporter [Herbaspirillum sp. Sphag1AN]MBB3245903.1 chromate transporter [Herbaspirillum sp. Sphag64]